MSHYSSFSDDYYINMNLNTEMDLPQSRNAVLHFFEQLQKHFPDMRNFYSRERGEYVLEGDKERGCYRWSAVEPRRICSGQVNPQNIDDALRQHRLILEHIPHGLSVSPLDCESLNLMVGFDFTYRGNQSQLLFDALGICPALEKMTDIPGVSLLANEPSIQLALDDECRLQCRVSFETRTTAFQVKTNDFPEDQLSVYLTVRRFGSLDPGETFVEVLDQLALHTQELIETYVAEHVLRPLQETIAIK